MSASDLEPNKFKKHKRNYSSINPQSQTEFTPNTSESGNINTTTNNNNQASVIPAYIPEDYLFLELKNKGIIDQDLDSKINEYRTNLSTNSNNPGNYYSTGDNMSGNGSGNSCVNITEKNYNTCTNFVSSMNLALKIEFNILRNSLDSSATQIYNLQSILNMKDKKLEILENALKNIKERKANRIEEDKLKQREELSNTNGINNSDNTNSNPPSNNFKRNRKTNSVNIPNLTEFLLKEDNAGENNTNNNSSNTNLIELPELSLKRELEQLKHKQQEELELTRNNLAKQSLSTIKNEKMKYEEKLREMNSDNCFLLSSLQNELEFIKNKLKSKEETLTEKRVQESEIEAENSQFEEKKKILNEKLNYYKSILNNINNPGESGVQANNSRSISITQNINNNDLIVTEEGHTNTSKFTFNSKDNNNNNLDIQADTKNNPFPSLSSMKVTTQLKYTKGHFRSQSLNNLFAKKSQQNSLSNLEYDMNYNTNQESFYSNKLKDAANLKALQLVYTLNNQEMRPYPEITKSSKQKIIFEKEKKPSTSSSGFFSLGNKSITNSNTSTPTNPYNNTPITLKKPFTGASINPEDYISNSATLEVHSIRAFNSKFIKK